MMEYDIHTVLDALTLAATLGVVFCMTATDMKMTYQKEQDIIKFYVVVGGGGVDGEAEPWRGVGGIGGCFWGSHAGRGVSWEWMVQGRRRLGSWKGDASGSRGGERTPRRNRWRPRVS